MPTVHVQLIDAATSRLLAELDLPPEQLPESFEGATTFFIGDLDWNVEHAEPMTRAEFVASGHLRVVLREVEKVDPKQILFSLPTLENALPDMIDGDAGRALAFADDDWRQREYVSARFTPEIQAERADIARVYETHTGVGFRELHVRKRIPEPLAGVTLAFEDVAAVMRPHTDNRHPIAITGHPGIIAGGFAFIGVSLSVYGIERENIVRVFAVLGGDPAPLLPLVTKHQLVDVEWCAAPPRS